MPNDTTAIPSTAPQVEAYFEGVIDRNAQKKVAVAINVNFELKDGQKERGHSIPIHAIPLVRRMHPNGVVVVKSKWARNISRCAELTQEELKMELEGLVRSYGMKLPGQAASYLAEVYGATEVEQLKNLHSKMREVYHAWLKLEQVGLKRVKAKFPGENFTPYALTGIVGDVLTDEEMSALVDLIEPEREELDGIDLPELEAVSGITSEKDEDNTAADPVEDGVDAIDWLSNELETKLGLTQQESLSITAAVVEGDGADPSDAMLATIKQLLKKDGTLNAKQRERVIAIVRTYRTKSAAAPV